MAKPFPEPRNVLRNELRERLLRAGVAPRHVRRYLTELADHLADLRREEESTGLSRAEAEAAALARLGTMDDLANAMIVQRNLQSWSARAPWAIFALAPALSLAAAWTIALLILWTGWQIFLPGARSPFVAVPGPVYGLENIYFQTGRMIYFGAPFFIGWCISTLAVRQRLQAIWPVAGLLLVAVAAATAQVHATRPTGPGTGHVGLGFGVGPSAHDISTSLIHALVILSLTVLPYLIWRLQRVRGLSA
jgi:hypothetical protein